MIDTITILFVAAILLFWSEIKSTPIDPCKKGHKWSVNMLNDRMECTQCGVRL